VTGPGPYQTIARIENPDNSGNDVDLEEPKAAPEESKGEDSNDTADTVGTDTSHDSRHTMAHSKPGWAQSQTPPNPVAVAAKAKSDAKEKAAEAKEKCDEAVKWYVEVLGFPEAAANALYVEQTLTDTEILSKLTDKSIDTIYEAVRKCGGASKGDPISILAVKRLKLAVFCLKLAVQTSRPIPD
jgi:hypothetical protein